ncbi:hypothetical protein GALMADRAFT_403162 [Galerina marginata CBS 339.88]|uniref:Uncharacterized protein n=1 Tax=Galerina marginata (strain CBS 339.88) TaxID=685588 RepID=A0A067TUV1_GALM3|nr:hypothetical protein GALMADRAFT_403162 [Galerina marginata CBS 339.88]
MSGNKEKENKHHSKKIAPGIVATVNRLETSKAVLTSLRNTANGSVEWLLFLKEAAGSAIGILASIQAIEDGEIDENFVALGLDSCALVYIITSRCQDESEADDEVFDQMKVASGEVTRVLHEIHDFVNKKAHRNFYKRVLKHSADGQKILAYRDQLKTFVGKFGKETDSSIHDVLEEIIDEKLRRNELRERNSRSPIPQLFPEVVPVIETPPSPPPVPPKAFLVPPKPPSEESLKPPPPSIVISSQLSDERLVTTVMPNLQAQRPAIGEPQLAVESDEEKERRTAEAEAKRKKRLEDELARKRAEKERWRRSEQSFIQLPDSAHKPEEQRLSTAPQDPIPLRKGKSPVVEILSDSEPELDRPLSRRSTKTVRKVPSQFEDEKIAAALHAKMQRELEEEDEKAAILEAAKLQREWEAEERKNNRAARPKKKKTKRSPTSSSSFRESPSPEMPPPGLPSGVLEGLRHEARRGGSESSARYRSESPIPETATNRAHAPDSTTPPYRNDVQYSACPSLPNPHDPNYYPGALSPPPPPPPPPPMGMHQVAGSAISMGGGPVTNMNSGNTHTTTIINSMNDHSVRYLVADRDDE